MYVTIFFSPIKTFNINKLGKKTWEKLFRTTKDNIEKKQKKEGQRRRNNITKAKLKAKIKEEKKIDNNNEDEDFNWDSHLLCWTLPGARGK